MIYYRASDIPARAWRKSRVVCAVEGCSLLTYSLTVPFGKSVSDADLLTHLNLDLDALDWGDDACWDRVEMMGFNAAMGRQCRFWVARMPKGLDPISCDVAWPLEAGMLGEAEAMMVGDLSDAPADSCENMGWVLWRGERLAVLVCREGRPAHWLCEEGWTDANELCGRLERLAEFTRKDPLLGSCPLRWFVSGDHASADLEKLTGSFGGADVRICDLHRGLERLEKSPLASLVPNMAARMHSARQLATRRLWFRNGVACFGAMLAILLLGLGAYIRNIHLDSLLATETKNAAGAMQGEALRKKQQDSLHAQALALASHGPLLSPDWKAGPSFSALGGLLPSGARVEQVIVEKTVNGYGLAMLLTVREFAEADALATAVKALPGVHAVRMGDKKSGPDGVRLRLEIDL